MKRWFLNLSYLHESSTVSFIAETMMDITKYFSENCSDTYLAKLTCITTVVIILVTTVLEFFNHNYEKYCDLYMDLNHRVSRLWNFHWMFCQKQQYSRDALISRDELADHLFKSDHNRII